MAMLRILLSKDLKRAWRNPVPLLIFILLPFLITTLIGLAFGGLARGDSDALAPIKVGIVDEDDSVFTRFLEGSMGQPDFKDRIDARFLARDAAIESIGKGELSAVLIIPTGFSDSYLKGDKNVTLTLIKNPAESIYPSLAQEGAKLIVTTLNAVVRNFRTELNAVAMLLDSDKDYDLFSGLLVVSDLLMNATDRMEVARDYLAPPLVTYTKETREETAGADKGPEFNLFAYLLVGMAAMFLLMMADNAMRDLYREMRALTLERYRTLRDGLLTFVVSKVLYALAILLICAAILFGGGSLIFQFEWNNVPEICVLVACYGLFAAGLLGFVAALAGKERRADILNNILVMGMSLTGGAMWPPEQLPPFIRASITPLMPTYWFSAAVRGLQSGNVSLDWTTAALRLSVLGAVFVAVAAWMLTRRMEKGIKA